MNRIVSSALAALILAAASTPAFADSLYRIEVYGLNCPYCAYGVQKKIEAIPGVRSADVDLVKGRVTVRTADGVTLTPKEMRRVINSAGFTFHSMKRLPAGHGAGGARGKG